MSSWLDKLGNAFFHLLHDAGENFHTAENFLEEHLRPTAPPQHPQDRFELIQRPRRLEDLSFTSISPEVIRSMESGIPTSSLASFRQIKNQETQFNFEEQSTLLGLTTLSVATTIVNPPIGIALGAHALLGVHTYQVNKENGNTNELLNRSEAHLRNWNPDRSSTFDWGRFFIDLNYTHRTYLTRLERNIIENRWQSFTRYFERQHQEDPLDRVDAIYDYLYSNTSLGVENQTLIYHQMIDLLSDRHNARANCSNRLQITISALLYARLPEPFVLGFQLTNTHIEPVIFNKESREVYFPLSGAPLTREITAPIFHPEYILHTLLIASGRRSPIQDESRFLIAAPDSAHQNPGWHDIALLPLLAPLALLDEGGNEMLFSDFLQSNHENIAEAFSIPSTPLPPPAHERNNANLSEERMNFIREHTYEASSQNFDNAIEDHFSREDFDFYPARKNDPIFRSVDQAHYYYDTLRYSPSLQRENIFSHLDRGIERLFTKEPVNYFIGILNQEPEEMLPALAQLTEHQFQDISFNLTYINLVIDKTQERYAPGIQRQHFFLARPAIRQIVDRMQLFQDWLAEHPSEALRQLNSAPNRMKINLLIFMGLSMSLDLTRLLNPHGFNAFADQCLQAYAFTPPPAPPRSNNPLQNIFLVSPDFGPLPETAIARNGSFQRNDNAIQISPPTALSLISFFQGRHYDSQLEHLWDADFSRWFMDPSSPLQNIDIMFTNYYPDLLRVRRIRNESEISEDLLMIGREISRRTGRTFHFSFTPVAPTPYQAPELP